MQVDPLPGAEARSDREHKPEPPPPGDMITIWKQHVAILQHFNELEMKVRNFALTLLLAVLGASAVALRERDPFNLFSIQTSLSTCLLLVGLIVWLLFYVMDRFWYHVYLKTAVEQTESWESEVRNAGYPLYLTGEISKESAGTVFGLSIDSARRVDCFYLVVAALLLFMAIGTHVTALNSQSEEPASGFVCPCRGTPPVP
jgi:hypothetical protein